MARWPTINQKLDTFRLIGYQPFPEQRPIHASRATVLQIVGAEGAGKSQVTANEVTACVPWAKLVYLIGETYDSPRREFEYLRNNLIVLGALDHGDASTPKMGQWAMTTRTGCEIKTLSAREGASSVIATGTEPDIFCLCEAGILGSYSVLTAAVRRATRARGRVILSGTLKDDFGWYAALVDELTPKGNPWRGETFSLPAWANTELYPRGRDDPEIQRLEALLPDNEFQRTIAAKRVPSPALVFPEFSYAKHVHDCPYDPRLPVTVWVDPGYFPSAYAVLAVQFHGAEVWQIDEIYLNHHTHEQVIALARRREWWPNVERSVIDFAGRQHHAQKSAAEIWLAETGIRPRSQPVGVLDGISRHRSFLEPTPRLFHDPRCTGTLSEYKQYKRRTDRDGNPTSDEPIDADNHTMKAIAYGLVDKFGFALGARKLKSASVDWYGHLPQTIAAPEPARSDDEIERMLSEYGD